MLYTARAGLLASTACVSGLTTNHPLTLCLVLAVMPVSNTTRERITSSTTWKIRNGMSAEWARWNGALLLGGLEAQPDGATRGKVPPEYRPAAPAGLTRRATKRVPRL